MPFLIKTMRPTELEQFIKSVYDLANADRVIVNTDIPVLNADLEGTSQGRNKVYFIADRAYEIVSITEVHDTAMTSADGAALQIAKVSGTTAPNVLQGTSDVLDLITDVAFSGTDNIYTGFNLKGIVANTVTGGTMTNQVSSLTLASGDRLCYGFLGTIGTTYIALRTVLKKV